ncbi:MAG TPA: hypothetical protein VN655_05645 [Pseudolabrys sp.]|nr:hypothetical protein [Pseudolabrys sp.]
MTPTASRLPSRFPVGTKFVIEARPRGKGRPPAYVRHLEFPDGTKVRLPERPTIVTGKAMARRRHAR